jgi:hypothetical protein
MNIFKTRDAVKEQRAQKESNGLGINDFDFDDDFQEAPVMFRRKKKKRPRKDLSAQK